MIQTAMTAPSLPLPTAPPAPEEGSFIVFGRPAIGPEEICEVLETLHSTWIGTGPRVQEFERRMAEYQGVEHAVATGSCTAALHLALKTLGVGPGDEVIVPSMTFVATANVVVHVGARPVLVDVDPDSLCMGPENVERALTDRTKAIIPVHFAGWPAPMEGLRELADRRGLRIVQDAAHCVEGRIGGTPPARFGDITCFSFYATKNVSTGEGGMALTDDPELAHRMRLLSLHGLDKDAWKRFGADGYRHYDCVDAGFKCNLTDLQAALGIHQLARVEDNLVIRERQWQRYQQDLTGLPLTLPPTPPSDVRHARHLYTVLVDPARPGGRDELLQALHQRKVGTGVHYRPVHAHSYYRDGAGSDGAAFPVATDVGERTLSLPLGPGLRNSEQDRVVDALHEILR